MMQHARTALWFFIVAVASVATLSCEPGPPAPPPPATAAAGLPPAEDVVATVNGVTITAEDLQYALRSGGDRDADETPARRQAALETLIQQELASQRAVELGLENDHSYQEGLRRLQAQVHAFQRHKLAEIFFQQAIGGQAEVSDAEARRYFDDHVAQIRSEIHVWQIFTQDAASIDQVRDELAQGRTFEEVALQRFPERPVNAARPWDLGFLRWEQVPEVWWDALEGLEAGEVSDVIRGPDRRFWILKLIERRGRPDLTYDAIKPKIMERLQAKKVQRLRAQIHRELLDKARILYPTPPGGGAGDE